MEKENTIKENLSFCLFGTTEQRKISLDLIEKCLIENGIDISKCASQNTSTSDEALHIGSVNCWHSWHEHPEENSEIDVMWSDNSIDRLKYTLRGYNDLNFKTKPIPIKWRYACS